MKKRTKILLAVLGVFIISISVVVILQWNNIKAVSFYLMYSEEKLDELTKENEELIMSAMEKIPEVSLRELNDEEREMLASGEITEEEAMQLILGKTTLSKLIEGKAGKNEEPDNSKDNGSDAAADDSKDSGGDATTVDSTTNSNIDALMSRVYVLQYKFTSSLEGLKQSAIAEYKALPEEQRTSSAKMSIGSKYLGKASSLEGQCDSEMNSLISEIKAELKAEGKDTSLANDIRYAYANQKSITKAQYLSMYR